MLKKLSKKEAYTGVADDSRNVRPGYVFVAIKGLTVDGHDFIPDAIERGAVKIFGEMNVNYPNYTKVSDSRKKLGELAADFYGNPSETLKVIGVTGTKGKTTTCHLIHHFLVSLGYPTGIISSISAQGFHTTTPDVITINKELSDMVKKGYKYAVIEVGSHGIHQGRVSGINFEVGVLTNIAPEHLDYHKTFKEYKSVKMSFINSTKHKIIAPKETNLTVLPGKFNNLNVEAALMAVAVLGFKKQDAVKTLSYFNLPEGRLQEIKNTKGFRVFVDFAHTPDSLDAALSYLRTLANGKLISVFGCAAERDVKKRRKMGKVSGRLADLSVFTVEDVRFDNISNIFRLMKKDAKNYVCIPERGEAIAYALSIAEKGDVIGVFGKGHEKSLAYKGFEHPWSDQEAIKNYLDSDNLVSAVILAAGKGTRMKSARPKIIHEICGRPMVAYTLENLRKAKINDIVAVVSYRKNLVINKIKGAVKVATQKNSKGGTADAALTGYKMVGQKCETLLVINGDDSAFYTPETISKILKIHNDRQRKLTFVSLMKDNPAGLGRVIRGKNGLITDIIEEKDATEDQKKIKEVNDGLYVFDRKWFDTNIKNIKKGPQGEFYINDLVKMAIDHGDRMATYTLPNDDEWQGINTPEQLAEANKKMAEKLNNK